MTGALALAGQAPAADAIAARLTCQGFEVTRLGAAGLPSEPEVFFRDLRTALVVARDIADCEAILFEETALVRSAPALETVVIASALSPRYVRALRNRIDPRVALVDAPFHGTLRAAETGALALLAGGPVQTLDTLAPLFAAIGQRVLRTGAFGTASAARVLQDCLRASSSALTRIAMDWAEAQGIEDARLLRLVETALGPTATDDRVEGADPMPAPGCHATLGHLSKDIESALDTALAGSHLIPPHAMEALFRAMRSRALH